MQIRARTHNREQSRISPPNGHCDAEERESRPIWEVVAALGAEIPDEEWAAVPHDGSINYRHYLHGAPLQK